MLKFVTDKDFDAFEDYVSTHPKGHFMQSLKWAEFKKPIKHAAVLSVDENGKIRGAMSLFVYPERFYKYTILYAPRGPVCDANDLAAMSDLFEGARKIARENHAYKLTIDPDITEQDTEFLANLGKCGVKPADNTHDNGILQPFSVFRININKTEDELLSSFHSKARYSVRSSLKSGAICRIGGREDLPVFRELLKETAERDGFTARGIEYFEKMYDTLAPDNMVVFMIDYENMPIAGSVLIRYGNKSWHMYAGSSEKYKETLPNFLMQWEMMRWSVAHGCDIYDMRGIAGEGDKTKPLEGLTRFKKRFGGDLLDFVGRMDIVYNPVMNAAVFSAKSAVRKVRKIIGGK